MTAQLSQDFRLEIDGVTASFSIAAVRGLERLHAPWIFDVICVPFLDGAPARQTPEQLLTKTARLIWPSGGAERTFHGLIEAVDFSRDRLTLTVVPKVAILDDAVDFRMFIDLDAVEIATKVLQEQGLKVDAKVQRTLPKRPSCTQAFESNLAFVARILAEEGITWFSKPNVADVIAFTDHATGFPAVEGVGSLHVHGREGGYDDEVVVDACVRTAVTSDKVSLRDYDFTKPLVDQTSKASAGPGVLERYEYPGGYSDPKLGNVLAAVRLEELRARRIELTGRTFCRGLSAGCVITLVSDRAAVDGRWLVVELQHDGRIHEGEGDERRYEARFVAIPAATPHRPARTAAPSLGGVQTATVTGATGSEIHTDPHGQMKSLLRWDRRSHLDDKSSAWFRSTQPPTSGGLFIPRVGWEVLLSFHGGAGDVPYELGRLYNSGAPPPAGLPGKKTASAFGTLTTPGGGSANGVSMDDAAGSEKMSFDASKDFNEKTENDKVTNVTANDTTQISANRTVITGQVHRVEVKGAQSYSVGSNRTLNVDANVGVSAASESVMIGGLRTFKVGGDYGTSCATLMRLVGAAKVETAIEHQSRSVKGASTTLVAGSWKVLAGMHESTSVGGASTLLVAGEKSITCATNFSQAVKGALNETLASRNVKAGGDREEGFGAAASYKIGGSATFKGSDVVITAKAKITIKADGCTITITPGKIKIDGKFTGDVASEDDGSLEEDD